MSHRPRHALALLALGVLALPGYMALPRASALAAQHHVLPLIVVYGGLFLLYLPAALLVLRGAAVDRRVLQIGLGWAALFRVILLPGFPVLSGDPYRYVWDARLLLHGISPYLYAPDDPRVRFLHDSAIYPLTGWHSVPTLYPPGAQALFALTYLIQPDNVIAVKVALLLLEGVTIAALMALLRARGQDPARALLYAWNPLAVLEVAGSGHIDAAAATAIVMALLAERKGRPALAGALLGAAALLKLFPLALLAALAKRDLGRAVPAALVVVVAGYLPFIVTGARPAGYLGQYVADQDVNAVFYIPAHLASGIGLRHALHALPLVALLMALAAIVWRRWRGGLTMETTALLLLLAILLFSPSMYAWYLLTALPFLSLGLHAARRVQRRTPCGGVAVRSGSLPGPALYVAPLLFSGTVILEYTFTTGGIPVWWVGVLEYLPLYIPLAAAAYPFCSARDPRGNV